MNAPWFGKHMWIWQLEECENGSVEAVIARAKDLGLAGLMVKAWDGGSYWSQFERIAAPAKDAGLVVGAWGYSYGNNISGEVNSMKKAVTAGANWLIIDAESEYESQAGKDKAFSLFKSLSASSISGVALGYSSFAFTDLHALFPYEVFSSFCSIALPQVYWGEFRMSPDRALNKCLTTYQQYGLPVMPVGQCYSSVTPEEILVFGKTADVVGAPGISYWSWQHATGDMMAAIKELLYEGGKPGVSDWAKESWNKAVSKGILDGTEPQGAVTREMLAVVLDRLGLLEPTFEEPEALFKLSQKAKFSTEHVAREQVNLNLIAVILERLGLI